jgi:MFS family permease
LLGYAWSHTLTAYVLSTLVWSVGDLLLVGRAYAIVAELAPQRRSGRYLAVYGVSWGVAAIVAPLTGTQLLQRAGATVLWTAPAAACFALALLAPIAVRFVVAGTNREKSDREPS